MLARMLMHEPFDAKSLLQDPKQKAEARWW